MKYKSRVLKSNSGSVYLNCHSNVIYRITCSRCFLHYVGEAGQNVNERFNWLKSCVNSPPNYGFCQIFYNHVNIDHIWAKFWKKLDGNRRTAHGALNDCLGDDLLGSKFPALPRKSRISHLLKSNTFLSPREYLDKFKFYLQK